MTGQKKAGKCRVADGLRQELAAHITAGEDGAVYAAALLIGKQVRRDER